MVTDQAGLIRWPGLGRGDFGCFLKITILGSVDSVYTPHDARWGGQVNWRITSARSIDVDLNILLAAVVDMLWRRRRCLSVY